MSLLMLVKIYNGIITQAPFIAQSLRMNGVAERAVRRVKEGAAIALVQSGLPEEWWDCAMECSCFLLRNMHDNMADGKTAFEKRYS